MCNSLAYASGPWSGLHEPVNYSPQGEVFPKTFFASLKIPRKWRGISIFLAYASGPWGGLHEPGNNVPSEEICSKTVYWVTEKFPENDGEFWFPWLMHPAPGVTCMSQEITFLKGKFPLKTFFASLKISLKMTGNFDFPGLCIRPLEVFQISVPIVKFINDDVS